MRSVVIHTSAQRLRDEKHVRDLVPRVRVDHGLVLLVDTAGAQLYVTVNISNWNLKNNHL